VIAMIQSDTRTQLMVGCLSGSPFNIQHAIDDMGGITLNIANVGAIVDIVSTVTARNNRTGQGLIGQQMQEALNGVGVFEVHITSGGATGDRLYNFTGLNTV
jgi:hypothetical protein